MGTPWSSPQPPIQHNPLNLGNRTTDSGIGNRYGANNLLQIPTFTPGIMSPAAKAEMTAAIDFMMSIWPYDFTVENGIVRIAMRKQQFGVPTDPRAGAPALNAIETQLAPYSEGTVDVAYGGAPAPFIDWDYMPLAIVEKIYQMWYDFKVAIAAI